MSVIVKNLGSASGGVMGFEGWYLMAYDIEAHDGVGDVTFTRHPDKALRFADLAAFHAAYTSSPKCKPFRPDGKPNRPLTATHWEMVGVP